MKKAACLLLLLSFAVFGQDKPSPNPNTSKCSTPFRRIPRRKLTYLTPFASAGIDFEINDGILGLTRSKAANDEDVQSALEEAGRRHANPDAAKLPSAAEADALIVKAREATAAALDDMPDFVVKQVISRSDAFAGYGQLAADRHGHRRDQLQCGKR